MLASLCANHVAIVYKGRNQKNTQKAFKKEITSLSQMKRSEQNENISYKKFQIITNRNNFLLSTWGEYMSKHLP